VVQSLEHKTQQAQESDRLRQEAQALEAAAKRQLDMQTKQLSAANKLVTELHAQVNRLERDSGDAVRGCQ
jgi:hypothetical protein